MISSKIYTLRVVNNVKKCINDKLHLNSINSIKNVKSGSLIIHSLEN